MTNKRYGWPLVLIFLVIVYFTIPRGNKRINVTNPQNTETVLIDSVKLEKTNVVLPDKVWVHYTKYGPSIISKTKLHEVGDSIFIPTKKNNDETNQKK